MYMYEATYVVFHYSLCHVYEKGLIMMQDCI